MEDILYGYNSALIALILFILIVLANECGYRYARRTTSQANGGVTSQTNAIQAGMLGLLALLLGFSFNMALQRYDIRSAAVLEESNAIGTANLRAELLPELQSTRATALIREYVLVRVEGGKTVTIDQDRRRTDIEKTAMLQAQLWRIAQEAANIDPRPVTAGLFLQSINDVIDAYGVRQAALQKHVPEVVLFLLIAIFVISGSVQGYASGLAGGRPWLATVSLAGLIVLVVFIVIDLDRPRRGLIEVDQSSMIDLSLQLQEYSRE